MKTLDHRFAYCKKKIYNSYNVTSENITKNDTLYNFNTVHLKNCYFINNCFINDNYIISLTYDGEKEKQNLKKYILKCYNSNKPSNTSIVNDNLYLWHSNTNNYLHFVRDCLLVLEEYISNENYYKNFKILVKKEGFNDFVIDILKTLNLYQNIVFLKDIKKKYPNELLFKNLHIPVYNNPELSKKEFRHYKIVKKIKKLVNNFSLPKDLIYDKIYISRRTWTRNTEKKKIGQDNTQKRKCLNEDEIVKILKEKKYKEIFLEDYDFVTKLAILNNAKTVLTTHGAGVVNFLFTRNIEYIVLNSQYKLSDGLKEIIKIDNIIYDLDIYKPIAQVYVGMGPNMPYEIDICKFKKMLKTKDIWQWFCEHLH